LKATPKMLQKWQAYHRYRQTYDATWKATVEKAWTDHKSEWEAENPGVAIPRTKHFEVMNEYIKKTFDDETPEKKQEVEDYRKKLKDEKDEGVNEDNEYQTYVTVTAQVGSITHTITQWNKFAATNHDDDWRIYYEANRIECEHHSWRANSTGRWKNSNLHVRNIPLKRNMQSCDLGVISANFGKTIAGNDFKEFLGDADYENNIMAPFDDFLHECFSTCKNPI